MKVYFVGAGPGAPDLLTIRGKALLEKACYCIYAGSLINHELLDFLPEGCKKYDSAAMSLEEIVGVYQQAQKEGVDVVRLHSGDPSIYGAIQEQMERLDELDMGYEVVPGVSSFQAAAAALKQELTVPEVSQTVILTRGKGWTDVPERERLSKLAAHGATLCIFLSAALADEVVQEIVGEYGEDCPTAVVYKATWPEQKIIRTTLGELPLEIKKAAIGRSAIIFVGRALKSKGTRSTLYLGAQRPTTQTHSPAVQERPGETRLAMITLSQRGYETAKRIRAGVHFSADLFVPAGLRVTNHDLIPFQSGLLELTAELFPKYGGLVYVLPIGAAVRSLSQHMKSKKTDPAVVAVDNVGRYVVSLLSGHEGGANRLAMEVANALRTDAIITTASEAEKEIIVGIGCRKGAACQDIVYAVRSALEDVGLNTRDVRLLATADIKVGEEGLHQAARQLGIPLKIISSEEIRNTIKDFDRDRFVKDRVGLEGVCEPAALLAGRKTILVAPKKKYSGVAVAIARECFTW